MDDKENRMSDSNAPSVADSAAADISEAIDGVDAEESSEVEGDENSDESVVAVAVPEVPKSNKKKLKLKVDGQELEEEFDLDNEEELKKHFQQSKAFNKRSQELSQYQKQVNDFMSQLKADPSSVLEQLGFNVDDFAEKRIEKMIEHAKKSPVQIEYEKLQEELKSMKDKFKKEETQRQEAVLERMKNQYAAEIESDINKALDASETILPKKNPWVLRKVAEYMGLAMKNGYPQVTAKDVIPIVEGDYKADLESLFGEMPEAVMEKVIGKKNLDRLRKQRLKSGKAQTATARQVAQPTGQQAPKEDENKPKKTYKSIFGYGD